MTQKIAIIGSGISGLTCAYLLHKEHDVTVFEANDYIGGHTATIDVEIDKQEYAIDTGFIVFNDWTYPNFMKLLDKLQVEKQPTQMSFSVKNLAENLEYNGHTLNTLFAQRRNIFSPRFWGLVSDILRFNRICKEELTRQQSRQGMTLNDFLCENGFREIFIDNYIYPMCAAIWSASLESIKSFPLRFFLQFFNNHGLLNVTDRPQWYTLIGGSRSYIAPITSGYRDNIRLNSPVQTITQNDNGYRVLLGNGKGEEQFDQVIVACHSDQALAMLAEPSEAQRQVLGNIDYAPNDVILHTDISVLPKRPLAWASWNYLLTGEPGEKTKPATLTYNMNILQRLDVDHTFCVTLNANDKIDPQKILRKFNYAHPQFNNRTISAQTQREQICGVDGLHFCGAYWYNGFHEDGVRSALDVCQRFGIGLS
ncbi:MAG: NAD(P)/FAD-dependent oxidoreductase [Aestuariibacter sp.]